MVDKDSSAGDGDGEGEVPYGNGDYNLPDFIGEPNAPQRLELQRLADQQEIEQERLASQQARALASSRPEERQRLVAQQQDERRRLRDRHLGEQQRLIGHQQRRSPHHPRLQIPWSSLYTDIYEPPPPSAGLRTNAGVGQRWKAPFVESPLRNTTNADAVAYSTTSAADALTPPSEEEPEGDVQEAERDKEQIVKSKAKREEEKKREREAEILHVEGELPGFGSFTTPRPEDSIVEAYFLPQDLQFAPASKEARRACPSRWNPSMPRAPFESVVRPAPTSAEWNQTPVTYFNDGTPHPRPGDILPLPPPRRNEAAGAYLRRPRLNEERQTGNPQGDDGNMNAGGFIRHQPTSHEGDYRNDSAPYYSHPAAESNYYNNGTFHHPQPMRMHNTPYGPQERPFNAANNDDRHMSDYSNHNPYPTPYSRTGYNAPPRHRNEDGLEMLSNVAAAQPPASSLPPLPQHRPQHGYYHPDPRYSSADRTTPPPSSPISAPTSGRSNIALPQLPYLGQGPAPASAPTAPSSSRSPCRRRPLAQQHDNDDTEMED
ncbi:hypothetical protein PG997_002893 [Apiospora hydei]|uniref:Uncharacterized protein n=1 Tax=Apiospora hydei TaxID=1337664 RepID=A0ABR1WXW5_9PEZI